MAKKDKKESTIDLLDQTDLQTLTKKELINKLLKIEKDLHDNGAVTVVEQKEVTEVNPALDPFKMEVKMYDNALVTLTNVNEICGFLTNNKLVKSAVLL